MASAYQRRRRQANSHLVWTFLRVAGLRSDGDTSFIQRRDAAVDADFIEGPADRVATVVNRRAFLVVNTCCCCIFAAGKGHNYVVPTRRQTGFH